MVLAPGRFSTTTCWPSRVVSDAASMRDSVSLPPPGANGDTMRTGFTGQVCADVVAGVCASAFGATANIDSKNNGVRMRWAISCIVAGSVENIARFENLSAVKNRRARGTKIDNNNDAGSYEGDAALDIHEPLAAGATLYRTHRRAGAVCVAVLARTGRPDSENDHSQYFRSRDHAHCAGPDRRGDDFK